MSARLRIHICQPTGLERRDGKQPQYFGEVPRIRVNATTQVKLTNRPIPVALAQGSRPTMSATPVKPQQPQSSY